MACLLSNPHEARAAAAATAAAGGDAVKASATAPTTEYIYYDPAGTKPACLSATEIGKCEPTWQFSSALGWKHHDTPPVFKLHFNSADCSAALATKIYLPKNATSHIKAHEEGHRHINEHFYNTYAKNAIKAAVETIVGHDFSGRAATYEAAKNQILAKSVEHLKNEYYKRTSAPAKEANDSYDLATDHGKNDVDALVAADEAIRKFAPAGEATASSQATPAAAAPTETPMTATPAQALPPMATPAVAAPAQALPPAAVVAPVETPQPATPTPVATPVAAPVEPEAPVLRPQMATPVVTPMHTPATSQPAPPTPTTSATSATAPAIPDLTPQAQTGGSSRFVIPELQKPAPFTLPEPSKSMPVPGVIPTPNLTPSPASTSESGAEASPSDVPGRKHRKILPPPSSILSH